MKQRIVTACIGLVVFFIVLVCFETVIYDIVICIVSLIAVHELLLATKCTKNIPLSVTAMALAVVPFIFSGNVTSNTEAFFSLMKPIVLFTVVGIMFMIFLKYHVTLRFEKVAMAFFIASVIPFTLSTLVHIRNEFGLYQGLYYTMLIFCCSWGADSGAYFAGRFLGKKKLAPKISPNKTVEGVYGGVVSSLLFVSLITVLYYFFMQSQGQTVSINYIALLFIGVVGSLIGVLGDLAASTIKRQFQIKDYGSIMPGHGGVLDRFDSVLFVAPFIFVVLKLVSV